MDETTGEVALQMADALPLDVIDINAQQVDWLFDGHDLDLMQGHASLPLHTVLQVIEKYECAIIKA